MWDVFWIDKSGYAHAASFRDKSDAEAMCDDLDATGEGSELRVEYRDFEVKAKA